MVITIVIDMFGDPNNGTTVTGMRTAKKLRELGNEVRIIAFISPKTDPKDLEGFKVLSCRPLWLNKIPVVAANGFSFGSADDKEIADFIRGSDVVHLMFPFWLENRTRLIAKAMGTPVTSAYHLQPDNVSFNLHLGHCKFVNNLIYHLFSQWLYCYTRTVHTPSETMKDLMLSHHYRNDIHAISNGVVSRFVAMKSEKPEALKDKYIILMVGRLSGEKRQDLIIKAVGHSKYNAKIQVILCGQGPRRKYYEKLSRKYLKNQVIFKFVNQDDLLKIVNYTDLYIHASDAESEAIAAIEAFSCGIVPVISDSKASATNHFALDQRCLFRAGDYHSLSERIEYFYDHPEVIRELSPKYREYGKTFAIDGKVKALQNMMKLEIERDQEDKMLGRTYFSSMKERRRLRAVAKKIGLEHPFIFKKDVYHSK